MGVFSFCVENFADLNGTINCHVRVQVHCHEFHSFVVLQVVATLSLALQHLCKCHSFICVSSHYCLGCYKGLRESI